MNIDGTPGDREILVFNASSGNWEALDQARLDFVFLSTDDDEFTIISDAESPTKRVRLNLGPLPNNADLVYNFPNASGTFALQNQFTMFNVDGAGVTVPDTGFGEAFATCPTGSKAVGVGISALPSVSVQDMRIMTSTQVRIRVRKASTDATQVNAVAYCLTMP